MIVDEALVLLDPETLDAEHAEHQDVVDAGRVLAAEVRALRQRLDLVSPCPTCGTLTAAESIDVNGECLACHLRRHR